jgi:hypothetical protein
MKICKTKSIRTFLAILFGLVCLPISVAFAGTIGGAVFVDANKNGKMEPWESGVPGITITLTCKTDDGRDISLSVKTDQNGWYFFYNVPTGICTLSMTPADATKIGYQNPPEVDIPGFLSKSGAKPSSDNSQIQSIRIGRDDESWSGFGFGLFNECSAPNPRPDCYRNPTEVGPGYDPAPPPPAGPPPVEDECGLGKTGDECCPITIANQPNQPGRSGETCCSINKVNKPNKTGKTNDFDHCEDIH